MHGREDDGAGKKSGIARRGAALAAAALILAAAPLAMLQLFPVANVALVDLKEAVWLVGTVSL